MLEILNPATEEVVERIEPATASDADAAVARANKAFPAWR
ncbi:MAG TPA: aldehyde dehydrogenase family protein, partial [Rubrobacter sp.]|nr:aldehyde dehydrogenase family protein [Rubrobacter sp.]